jgi:hypothetical protein
VDRTDRHADVAENRVLVFLLDRIADAAQEVAKRSEKLAMADGRTLSDVEAAAARLRANAALSTARAVSAPTGIDRQALRSSRLPEFRNEVGAVLALHDSLFSNDLTTLRALLGDRVWLPPEPDRVFELLVLFQVILTLEDAGWTVASLRLLGAGNGSRPAFVLGRGDCRVRVGFQGMPPRFLAFSQYTSLLESYGIDGNARRPDLIITAEGPGGPLYLLLEAKLTEDRNYVVDSIYKTLGYLADFEVALLPSPNPQGVLITWGGINAPPTRNPKDPILILDEAGLRAGGIVSIVNALAEAARVTGLPTEASPAFGSIGG